MKRMRPLALIAVTWLLFQAATVGHATTPSQSGQTTPPPIQIAWDRVGSPISSV